MVALLLGLILSLFVIELFLRLATSSWEPHGNEPTTHEPHPTLGWKNKEGEFVYPAYVRTGKPIKMTFLADGSRVSGTEDEDGRDTLVLVGGSITRGSAISDYETFAWKLEEKYPSLKVRNYGTGAYGTYQSLLMLEWILSHSVPSMVFYGFSPVHEIRNVATYSWLKGLSERSKRGAVYVPYVSMDDDGELVRHPPEAYVRWRLSKYLVSIISIQHLYARATSKTRSAKKREITKRLILRMHDLCAERGILFAAVLLYANDLRSKSHYVHFLRKNGIRLIDCYDPIKYPLTTDLVVPREGHPNGKMNTFYANCIAKQAHDIITGLK